MPARACEAFHCKLQAVSVPLLVPACSVQLSGDQSRAVVSPFSSAPICAKVAKQVPGSWLPPEPA